MSNYSELLDLRSKLAQANIENGRLNMKLTKFRKVTKLMENQVQDTKFRYESQIKDLGQRIKFLG